MGSLLREQVGATFSDRWYRVSGARPRLSPAAQVTRQVQAGEESFIIEEPAGGRYYRLSTSAWWFAGLLDGKRTVEEAWRACAVQLGDDAPTQHECLEVLARLQSFGLLHGDQPMAADALEQRIRRVREAKFQRRTGKWFAFTLPLLNPEPWLARHEGVIKLLWSRWGFAVWSALMLTAAGLLIARFDELGGPLDGLMTPSTLLLMAVLFLVLRAIHELGHATACKAFGGRCTEVGLILIAAILPLPYCDASSAWRFPETWKRVLVSLGGMIAELTLAAVAVILWAALDPERAADIRTVAYHTFLISGATTIFFNLNPLLRYDGYYILSDLTGTPNLAQRSKELWKFLTERFAFGVKRNKPPRVRSGGEAWLMGIYGVMATPYRLFIAVSIVLLVSTRYATLGVALAVFAAVVMLVLPALKGVSYLASSPALMGHRSRAIALSAGVLGLIGVVLGIAPAPAGAFAPATIEPNELSVVRVLEQGFIDRVHAEPGEEVRAGQPLFTMRSDELRAERLVIAARLERVRAELDGAVAESPALALSVRDRMAVLMRSKASLDERAEGLVLRAVHDGVFLPLGVSGMAPDGLEGTFLRRGEPLAAVATTNDLVVRATVSDADHAWVFEPGAETETPATLRLRGQAGTELRVRVTSVAPAATRQLSAPSLSTVAGGELEVDPTDAEGQTLLTPRFSVDLEPVGELWDTVGTLRPGQRARVRLEAPSQPLLAQWTRKIRRYLDARLAG